MKVQKITRTERLMWDMGHVGDPDYQHYYTDETWEWIEVPNLRACWLILIGKITKGQGCWVLEDTCQS